MSTTTLVVTLIGQDRLGLVGVISGVLGDYGGNWEASRMARLGGRFAGIVQFTVRNEKVAELKTALSTLEAEGLKLIVEESTVDPEDGGDLYLLELVGNDQPHIVRRISQALAERDCTVLELSSEVGDAPMAGGKIFKMQASVQAPVGVSRPELRASLEELANSLMVDIRLDD